MATARDFINLAMKSAGVLGVGQSLLDEDVNDGLTTLNQMLAVWQKKRWLVPSLHEVVAVGNGQKSNTIGPGQYYNSARPDKIQAAYFVQRNNSSNSVSFPLAPIWSYEDYSLIALKELNSWPQYFFYDGAFPNGNVYIWPIPSQDYEIHLIIKSPIGFNINIEDGVLTSPGQNYVDGVYTSIPLLSLTGTGVGATADVTVISGFVTSFAIHDPGTGYNINDVLTPNIPSISPVIPNPPPGYLYLLGLDGSYLLGVDLDYLLGVV